MTKITIIENDDFARNYKMDAKGWQKKYRGQSTKRLREQIKKKIFRYKQLHQRGNESKQSKEIWRENYSQCFIDESGWSKWLKLRLKWNEVK